MLHQLVYLRLIFLADGLPQHPFLASLALVPLFCKFTSFSEILSSLSCLPGVSTLVFSACCGRVADAEWLFPVAPLLPFRFIRDFIMALIFNRKGWLFEMLKMVLTGRSGKPALYFRVVVELTDSRQ